MKRLSAKKTLLLLAFVCLLCTVLYYLRLSWRQTRNVREPREFLLHSRQMLETKGESHVPIHQAISQSPSVSPPVGKFPTTPQGCNEGGCQHPDTQEHSPVPVSGSQSKPSGRCTITSESIKHIKKFTFFIGYPRSGHSIVASFLDAHPHMIVAHEFSLFSWWPQYKSEHSRAELPSSRTRLTLFNELTNSSYWESKEGERSCKFVNKGYTLCTNSSWHGKCDGHLEVIGDKRAGGTCEEYLRSPQEFERNYRELLGLIDRPIRVIHVVRNPYDLIATSMLYEAARLRNKGRVTGDNAHFVTNIKKRAKLTNFQKKYRNDRVLTDRVGAVMRLAEAVTNLTALFGRENVLELHNCDMVRDAASFVRRLCEFHEVECSEDFVGVCAKKVFPNISRSRDYVHWPQEVVELVELQKEKYPFFSRYSLDGNC